MESEIVVFEELKGRNEILRRRDQISDSVVVIVLLLAESRAWNGHDSCFVDHIHAVHEIGWYILFASLFEGFFREMNLWESVHGTLDVVAGGPFHLIEGLGEETGSLFEPVQDLVFLSGVLFEAFAGLSALFWWVHHQRYCQLSDCVGT